MKKQYTAYLLARLPMGMSMFTHGAERMPKLTLFSQGMIKEFSHSELSPALVQQFSFTLPFLELLTGFLFLIGLFTRFACILGAIIMLALIFGSGMIEQWQNVFVQMMYGAYFALLYLFTGYNRFSVDGMSERNYIVPKNGFLK